MDNEQQHGILYNYKTNRRNFREPTLIIFDLSSYNPSIILGKRTTQQPKKDMTKQVSKAS